MQQPATPFEAAFLTWEETLLHYLFIHISLYLLQLNAIAPAKPNTHSCVEESDQIRKIKKVNAFPLKHFSFPYRNALPHTSLVAVNAAPWRGGCRVTDLLQPLNRLCRLAVRLMNVMQTIVTIIRRSRLKCKEWVRLEGDSCWKHEPTFNGTFVSIGGGGGASCLPPPLCPDVNKATD